MNKVGAKKGVKEKQVKTPKDEPPAPPNRSKNLKERPKSRHNSKKSGKAPRGNSFGDASLSSEENISQRNSQAAVFEDNAETLRLNKGKKPKSKECEEAVGSAVASFWESAWNVCADRFFISSAPITAAFELRNTWLRIAEAEWQDLDMRETQSSRPNRIFKKDEPPLPLSFDTWARGALEGLPKFRRESILDPFLRDLGDDHELRLADQMKSSTEIDEGEGSTEEVEVSGDGTEEGEMEYQYLTDMETAPSDSHGLDNWQFDLDEQQQITEDVKSGSPVETKISPDSQTFDPANKTELQIVTIIPARALSLDESTTDVDNYPALAHFAIGVRKSLRYTAFQPPKKFSPSQCGGRVGSGVFRLPNETTSSAIDKMMMKARGFDFNDEELHGTSHMDFYTAAQIAFKSRKSQKEDDESVVQPLFEERTNVRGGAFDDTHYRYHEIGWRGVSYSEGHYDRGPSFELVNSEVKKQFLKRKMINLHSRFRRQSVKYFTKPMKIMDAPHQTTSPGSDSRKSSASSTKSKNRVIITEKKNQNKAVSLKYSSHTALATTPTISRPGESISRVSRTRIVAKSVTSEPTLPKQKKDKDRDQLFDSLLDRRLETQNVEIKPSLHHFIGTSHVLAVKKTHSKYPQIPGRLRASINPDRDTQMPRAPDSAYLPYKKSTCNTTACRKENTTTTSS